jgi:hypothetical protein
MENDADTNVWVIGVLFLGNEKSDFFIICLIIRNTGSFEFFILK